MIWHISIRFLSKTDVMENSDYNVTQKFIIPNHGRYFYGIGIYSGKAPLNIGSLWRPAHILKADFIVTIGKRYKTMPSDTMKSWKLIPWFEFDKFRHFKDSSANGAEIVGVELKRNSIALPEFMHSERYHIASGSRRLRIAPGNSGRMRLNCAGSRRK